MSVIQLLLYLERWNFSTVPTVKKVCLKILQNSQESTCIGVSFLRKFQVDTMEEFCEIF